MYINIIDCQISAQAGRLMGHTLGRQDWNSAQQRMNKWAHTAMARDATWYALRFLCGVLLPEEIVTSNIHGRYSDPPFEYSARDDVLLNRP